MKNLNWNLNISQSDFMIRTKKSIIAYLDTSFSKISSSIQIENNQLIYVNVEFILERNLEHINSNINLKGSINSSQYPLVSFKSTSFEKINDQINYVKGNLTINNITKVVELGTKIIEIEKNSMSSKVLIEIMGEIKRQDFKFYNNSNPHNCGMIIGSSINITANLEFQTSNDLFYLQKETLN